MHSDGLVTAPRLRNDTNNRRGPFSKCNEDGMLCKNEEGVNACYECMNACMRVCVNNPEMSKTQDREPPHRRPIGMILVQHQT